MNALAFFIPGLIAVAAAYGLLVGLKRLSPATHAWFTAKKDRVAWLGIGTLLLAWVAVAIVNNARAGA